jgi:NitT/TauT family transport system ATP-binding protein
MIAVRRLTKRFGTEAAPAVALLYIEFSISEGELVVVVGPSGCGKSTPLRVLAGQLPQSEGEARLHGTPIGGPRRDIGVVFQAPVLLPWRSVLGNALLPVDVQRLGRDRMRERHGPAEAGRPWVRASFPLGTVRRHAAARRPGARADP